jgi:4'-phosphopantetheinyl transferase
VNEVHVACGGVGALLQSAPADNAWLGPAERARLARIGTDARRKQFLAARWQARRLLAQVAGGAAETWQLDAPADAPPTVAGHREWRLSVSHSGERVAVALATDIVGIDLEMPRARRDIDGLVALCCTDAEQALFAPLDAAQRAARFHQLWTVKESWLKARGEGMAPSRLRALHTRAVPQGEVRTWHGADGWIALCAPASTPVRWWTPPPPAAQAWDVSEGG